LIGSAKQIIRKSTIKDEIFKKEKKEITPFAFSHEVTRVFDDMVNRSIPFYKEIHQLIIDLLKLKLTKDNLIINDLGCSTGAVILSIESWLKHAGRSAHFNGFDNSAPMLSKCNEKLSDYRVRSFTLFEEDLNKSTLPQNNLSIMNYTLQFIDIEKRKELLKKIYDSLESKGLFILSEKITPELESNEDLICDLYYEFKKNNGYSELEIAQKREALINVLKPLTPNEQIRMLKDAGFQRSEIFFRWYNFVTYVCIKE